MTNEDKERNEEEIRLLMDDIAEAVRSKDIGRLIPRYAPDVLSFDVVNPLKYSGPDSIKTRMEQWFSSFAGPIGYETRDLKITACDETAFCRSLNHVRATKADGAKLDMWWRATLCFEKIEGKWLITHAHSSVPFDMETGLASLELKP